VLFSHIGFATSAMNITLVCGEFSSSSSFAKKIHCGLAMDTKGLFAWIFTKPK